MSNIRPPNMTQGGDCSLRPHIQLSQNVRNAKFATFQKRINVVKAYLVDELASSGTHYFNCFPDRFIEIFLFVQ